MLLIMNVLMVAQPGPARLLLPSPAQCPGTCREAAGNLSQLRASVGFTKPVNLWEHGQRGTRGGRAPAAAAPVPASRGVPATVRAGSGLDVSQRGCLGTVADSVPSHQPGELRSLPSPSVFKLAVAIPVQIQGQSEFVAFSAHKTEINPPLHMRSL